MTDGLTGLLEADFDFDDRRGGVNIPGEGGGVLFSSLGNRLIRVTSSLVIGCAPFSSALNLGGVVNSVEFGLDGVLKWGLVNFCGV